MASVPVVDAAGKKVGSRELPADIFEAKISVPLMHQVVVAAGACAWASVAARPNTSAVAPTDARPNQRRVWIVCFM